MNQGTGFRRNWRANRALYLIVCLLLCVGLIVASVMHRVSTGRLGEVARTVLFLPQVIPLVAAGII